METIKKIIEFTFYWLIIPSLLLQLILLGKKIGVRVKEQERKISAQAGWWAGLVLFAFFFVNQFANFAIPEAFSTPSININLMTCSGGIAVGMLSLWLFKKYLSQKAIGAVTALLSYSGSMSLYSYLFIRTYNELLLSATLGLVFGVLLYLIVFPKDFREFVVT